MDKKLVSPLIGILVIAWAGFSMGAYFVSHKPLIIQVAGQVAYSVWTLIITILLTINACALGNLTLRRLLPNSACNTPALLLAGGMGLGWLGILGFGMVLVGATHTGILLGAQVLILVYFYRRGEVTETLNQIRTFRREIKESATQIPVWMVWFASIAFALTALRTYLPPVSVNGCAVEGCIHQRPFRCRHFRREQERRVLNMNASGTRHSAGIVLPRAA